MPDKTEAPVAQTHLIPTPPLGVDNLANIRSADDAVDWVLNVLDHEQARACDQMQYLLGQVTAIYHTQILSGDQNPRPLLSTIEGVVKNAKGYCKCNHHAHKGAAMVASPTMIHPSDAEAVKSMQEHNRALFRLMVKAADNSLDHAVIRHLYTMVGWQMPGLVVRKGDDDKDTIEVVYTEDKSNRYNAKKRRQTRPARYLREAFIYHGGGEQAIEAFTYKMLAASGLIVGDYKLVEGDELVDTYMAKIGGETCMTHDFRKHHLDLFRKNPGNVKLLVYQSGKLTARALVWITDQGHRLVDRIYPNQGWHVGVIKKWAYDQGWYCRNHEGAPGNNSRGEPFIDGKGAQFFDYTITVELPTELSRYGAPLMPFLDSFHACTMSSDRSRGMLAFYLDRVGAPNAPYVTSRSADPHCFMELPCDECHQRYRTGKDGDMPFHRTTVDGVVRNICDKCMTRPRCGDCGKLFVSLVEEPGWDVMMDRRGQHIESSTCPACVAKRPKPRAPKGKEKTVEDKDLLDALAGREYMIQPVVSPRRIRPRDGIRVDASWMAVPAEPDVDADQ